MSSRCACLIGLYKSCNHLSCCESRQLAVVVFFFLSSFLFWFFFCFFFYATCFPRIYWLKCSSWVCRSIFIVCLVDLFFVGKSIIFLHA